jgi:uncharacterized protein with HEPN domain
MTDQGKKYLSDILQAITLIRDFVTLIQDYNDYQSDLKTQSAVERQLGIIGEAVKQFDKLFPEMELKNARKIVGFRNRLIHSYNSIDNSIVWVIIKRHLEPLQNEIENLIND